MTMIPQQSPIFLELSFLSPPLERLLLPNSWILYVSANALARFEVHDDPPKQLSSPRFPVAAAAADVLLLVHDSGVVVYSYSRR